MDVNHVMVGSFAWWDILLLLFCIFTGYIVCVDCSVSDHIFVLHKNIPVFEVFHPMQGLAA